MIANSNPPAKTEVSEATVLRLVYELKEASGHVDKTFFENILSTAFSSFKLDSHSVPTKDSSKTKAQLESEALKRKAEKYGLSTSEVKLTKEEKKSLGKTKGSSETKKEKIPSKSSSKKAETIKPISTEKTSDSSERTKRLNTIKTTRRRLKCACPSVIEGALYIHLLLYLNIFETLEYQWLTFQRLHDVSKNKSPFVGLRKIGYHEGMLEFLDQETKKANIQTEIVNDIEYYKLETKGLRFLNESGELSSDCPEFLKTPFSWPEAVEGELEDGLLESA